MNAPTGIAELLTVPNMKPELKAKACQNAILPILSGIAAIGDWMTQDTERCGLKDGTVDDTGYLLSFLANLALDLQHIEADAQFELRR